MNKANRICEIRKEIPASAMVSDVCSSISPPWVEMLAGGSQVWRTMGIADAIAITMIVIAKNFAIRLPL